jgi:hypothetical protein
MAVSTTTGSTDTEGTPHARWLTMNVSGALIIGVLYLLAAAVGAYLCRHTGFADPKGPKLLFFEINWLHTLLHFVVGVVLVLAALRGQSTARGANLLVGAFYLLLAVAGTIIVLDGSHSSANVFALDTSDNLLHAVTAAFLIGIGLSRDREVIWR